MSLFEIKHRWNGSVLFSLECGSMKLCVEAAVRAKADLSSADLSSANLSSADLSSANLSSADLSSADLRSADLSSANLFSADLRSADLRSADLFSANLRSADLRSADLSSANLFSANLFSANLFSANLFSADLSSANLFSANLSSADLSSADLRSADLSSANITKEQLVWFRDDIWAVLSSSPAEVLGLREALVSGKVDGSTYEGDCCCLVGTLANARHCEYDAIPGLTPNSSRPAEQWFYGIKKGDTPETNRASKFALEWVDQWMGNMRAAFGADLFTEGRA